MFKFKHSIQTRWQDNLEELDKTPTTTQLTTLFRMYVKIYDLKRKWVKLIFESIFSVKFFQIEMSNDNLNVMLG